MPVFTVSRKIVEWTTVEAETEEDAIELCQQMDDFEKCTQMSDCQWWAEEDESPVGKSLAAKKEI